MFINVCAFIYIFVVKFKSASVTKAKERLRRCHRLEETKGM